MRSLENRGEDTTETVRKTKGQESNAMRRLHIRRVVGLAIVACLVCVARASGLTIGLPFDGTQVNNDPMNGIDPNQDAGR